MAFSQATKQQARSDANYTCCWCRQPGTVLHVHHIEPQSVRVDDSLDNAAVLCPNCHYAYGHDPGCRSQVRERRDDWNRRCAQRFAAADPRVLREISGIQLRLAALEEAGTITNRDVAAAIDASGGLMPAASATPAEMATTEVVLSATANLASTYLSYVNPPQKPPLKCRACNYEWWSPGDLTDDDPCPVCGARLFKPDPGSS